MVKIESQNFTAAWNENALADELAKHPRRFPLVAVEAEELVGYAFTWVIADELHLVSIAVEATHQRRGIARLLMQSLLGSDVAQNATVMTLEVRAGNEAALGLYREFGFLEVAIRPRYYPDNHEDAVVMLKPLRARGGGDPGPEAWPPMD